MEPVSGTASRRGSREGMEPVSGTASRRGSREGMESVSGTASRRGSKLDMDSAAAVQKSESESARNMAAAVQASDLWRPSQDDDYVDFASAGCADGRDKESDGRDDVSDRHIAAQLQPDAVKLQDKNRWMSGKNYSIGNPSVGGEDSSRRNSRRSRGSGDEGIFSLGICTWYTDASTIHALLITWDNAIKFV